MKNKTMKINELNIVGGGKPLRESNLELLRIFAMLAIIAHHMVVNSTVIDCMDFFHPTYQTYFLMVWGMWGKTAINSFILISGYFLCKGRLTWQRYLKLLVEIYFYKFFIMVLFALSGYEPLTFKSLAQALFGPLRAVNNGFSASFLAFYLFVPIYNALIGALNKRQHGLMLCGLLLYFTVASTFLNAMSMNEPFWYMTLYFIAAYIRLYPNRWTESRRVSLLVFAGSVVASVVSVLVVIWCLGHAGVLTDFCKLPLFLVTKLQSHASQLAYWFVSDSNKLLALVVGLSAFLVAKNAPKFHSKMINTMSAGTFAVLLIHASSDAMRRWLWQDVVGMPELYTQPIFLMVIVSVLTPIVVFGVGTTIDYFRREWIEQPMMKRMNRM